MQKIFVWIKVMLTTIQFTVGVSASQKQLEAEIELELFFIENRIVLHLLTVLVCTCHALTVCLDSSMSLSLL